jgi:3-oxoacyl-[acyl-carrier protein] reductase
MSLKGKLALVTGADRGIGKAIAFALAQQGARIVATGIVEADAAVIDEYCKENNFDGCSKVLNVTDLAAAEKVLGEIKEEFGSIDILVNNAGITKDNLMLRMKEEEWQAVIDVNLTAVFRMSKLCMRDMIKTRWGRIVNISSVVGVIGNPGQANYAASKAGIIGFSKSLAKEIAARNVTVNCVAPGFIDTQMTQQLNEEQRDMLLEVIPMRRMGQPEDVANAVAFLASDAANYITGQVLNVNGGMI